MTLPSRRIVVYVYTIYTTQTGVKAGIRVAGCREAPNQADPPPQIRWDRAPIHPTLACEPKRLRYRILHVADRIARQPVA